MISQPVKNLYYASLGRLSALSYAWHRLSGAERFRDTYVNLGCGTKYVPEMINIDGNILRKKDLWLDINLGLPFPDNSLCGIYSSHMIEHLRLRQVQRLFVECYRTLKPGGRIRLVVPSLERAIEAYLKRDLRHLPAWPDALESPGGRFNNLMLCANQHLIVFDFSLLDELLAAAGFSAVLSTKPQESVYFKAAHMQFESDPALVSRSLYVEAVKTENSPTTPENGGPQQSKSGSRGKWHG